MKRGYDLWIQTLGDSIYLADSVFIDTDRDMPKAIKNLKGMRHPRARQIFNDATNKLAAIRLNEKMLKRDDATIEKIANAMTGKLITNQDQRRSLILAWMDGDERRKIFIASPEFGRNLRDPFQLMTLSKFRGSQYSHLEMIAAEYGSKVRRSATDDDDYEGSNNVIESVHERFAREILATVTPA